MTPEYFARLVLAVIIAVGMLTMIALLFISAFEDDKTQKRRDMYYVQKSMEISASHRLALNYPSKCQNLHGHNWHVRVHCKSRTLNENGMVEDFTLIKKRIHDKLDHKNLNEIFDFNPTAENMAKWMCEQIPTAYKVSIQESDGNIAVYVKEGERDEDQ